MVNVIMMLFVERIQIGSFMVLKSFQLLGRVILIITLLKSLDMTIVQIVTMNNLTMVMTVLDGEEQLLNHGLLTVIVLAMLDNLSGQKLTILENRLHGITKIVHPHLTHSLDDHDRFGAPPVWRFLPSYRLCEATDPGDGRSWFAVDDGRRRQRATALQALALALPGSVYLRQGDEVGLPDSDKPTAPLELAGLVNARAHDQGSLFGSPLATVRHATHSL